MDKVSTRFTPAVWVGLFVGALFLFGLYYLIREMKCVRDESECRDILEERVCLVAELLAHNPDTKMIKAISRLKYFPDRSGYFFVMDFKGNLYCHGGTGHCGIVDLTKAHKLPFTKPVDKIVEAARQGGGYVKYNSEGKQKLTFVKPVGGNSDLIIGSGMHVDTQSQTKRRKWKKTQKRRPRVKNGTPQANAV